LNPVEEPPTNSAATCGEEGFERLPERIRKEVLAVFDPADPNVWVRQPIPALGGISFLQAWERPDGERVVADLIARARVFEQSLGDHSEEASSRALPVVSYRPCSYACGMTTWDFGPTIPLNALPPFTRLRITGEGIHLKGNLWASMGVSAAGLLLGLLLIGMYGYIVAGVFVFVPFLMPRHKYSIDDLRVRRGKLWLWVRGLLLETRSGTWRIGLWGWNTSRIAQALSELGIEIEGEA